MNKLYIACLLTAIFAFASLGYSMLKLPEEIGGGGILKRNTIRNNVERIYSLEKRVNLLMDMEEHDARRNR